MSGSIVDVSRAQPPDRGAVDVCVVGSGPAGATAAWELAQAGLDVVVLEEGPDLTGSALTQRDGEMHDQLYMERGARATADMGITVLQGRALGGGSVVNACDVVPIHDGVLRCWSTTFGLTGFTPEALHPFREMALADLSASTPPESSLNENNRILRDAASALGWRAERMMHNRVGCLGLGTCLLGCPADAKRNARFVAVPAALGAGATFLVRARATRIDGAAAEVKTLTVERVDARGHRALGSFEVRARTVVLAANAVGSAALLARSAVGNAHVGRHLSLQPQLPVTAVFDRDVRFIDGIPQVVAVTEFERTDDPAHGWWGFRIEAISGTPGMVASLLPTFGVEGKERMALYPRLAASLCLLPDAPAGHVDVDREGRLRIHRAVDGDLASRARDAARAAARLYLAAGAREVFVPVTPPCRIRTERDLGRLDAVTFRPASAPFLSAHQQGGVRLAASRRDGAADPTGLVYGTRGVHVVDSGGFPTSASSHTMAPIITVSRYLSRQMASSLGRP